ncbi:hypothetical protein D1164_09530 [Mariniphaga sediminis]|uniref:DUF5723 domain-containing protein n=1 Tax=Mariniphaga sediminis TaxID=1628158 RepID=A0A399D3R4_9BACT|nr:DUF5723 family protein [Mariniphaga sediminis]RIH65361.1 hypothetical protein D1164_09530 [Mariniphaga sediminis]
MKRTIIVISVLIPFLTHAQNTLYFMDRLPQSSNYNPAIVPNARFFIGLPGLGGYSAQAYNSGFHYNWLDNFIESVGNEGYNPDAVVRSIGNYNRFFSETRGNILSFGFKRKEKGYFLFNASINSSSKMEVASDIVYLLTDFDDIAPDDFPIVVDDIDLLTNNYLSLGFTYSHIIDDNLTLGITPHINFNLMGIQTKNISYSVNRQEMGNDDYDYDQSFTGEVILGLYGEINPDAVEGNILNLEEGLLPDNWPENTRFSDLFRNKSLSLDIGATYKLNEWMFSASVLNIGASHWKTNGYILNGNSNDEITIRENEKIKIGIPPQIYLGAKRQFSEKWNYAFLFHNTFYKGGSNASATLSLNGEIGKILSTSVSYTAGYKFDNIGLGFRLRFLPGTDLFFITDNVIQSINYKNAYRLSAAVGINLSFGIKNETPGVDG